MQINYEVKRLFNNLATVRSTTVNDCVRRNSNLTIIYAGQRMTIPLEKLKDPNKFQILKRKFKSKYNAGQTYELYDFPFVSDDQPVSIASGTGKAEATKLYLDLKSEFDELVDNFVPEFGNMKHVDVINEIKKFKDLLKKLETKESLSTAKTVAVKANSILKQIKFLIR